MDSGSDTETDDELYERLEQIQSPPEDAPVAAHHGMVQFSNQHAVVASNESFADQLKETPDKTEPTEAAGSRDTNATNPPMSVHSTSVPSAPLPAAVASAAPFIDSDDDEPPRFLSKRTVASAPAEQESPEVSSTYRGAGGIAVTMHSPTLDAAPTIAKPEPEPHTRPSPEPIPVPAAAAIRMAPATSQPPPPAYRPPPPQATGPTAAATPFITVATPVLPTSTEFKSPFSALAAQYQPPPPPVYGAPPTTYVPLPVYGTRAPSAVPASYRTPTIPCSKCTRVLPADASPVPIDGHGACSCCGRYYPRLTVPQGGSRPFCNACVTPPPAATAAKPRHHTSNLLQSAPGRVPIPQRLGLLPPCTKCARKLPPTAYPKPLPGRSSCACCGMYFSSLVARTGQSVELFCTTCVTPALRPYTAAPPAVAAVPPPAAPAVPVAAVASAAEQQPALAPSVASTTPATCTLCMTKLKPFPPSGSNRMQCQCCMVHYTREAFSKNQQRASVALFRRCMSCLSCQTMPAKFNDIKKKLAAIQSGRPVNEQLTKRQASHERRLAEYHERKKNQPSNADASSSLQAMAPPDATPEERREMEVDVRNLKLARRSIQRRRESNDLRGSTRVDYETQLSLEESKLNQKMIRVRRRNPALYEWLTQSIKVKAAPVHPNERDHVGKKKAKAPQKSSTRKRTLIGSVEVTTVQQPRTKRARTEVDEAVQPTTPRRATRTTPLKPEVIEDTGAQASSPRRVIPTRSRTARAASRAAAQQPMEIIDLVSD